MTDPSPEVLQLVTQWVAYAEEDLRTAEYLLTMDRDCPVRSVCFHSQQCIEKYLKAVLTCRSVEFPKMHDIGELLALIPAGLPLSWTPEDQRRITDYATVGRYPGELEGIGIQEAKEAVDCACQVKTAVLALLPDRIARP